MTSLKNPVILIVEDDEQTAELYANRLRDTYSLIITHDGDSALEQLSGEVDVVLLDRRMPGMAGADLIDEIRNRELDCRIAIVSAVEPDEDILELGFDDYLTKPVSEPELHSTIERLLKQAQYEKKISEFFSLARRKAILESSELSNETIDEEYVDLLIDIEELRGELARTVNEFDENNFRIACRDIALP